MCSGNIVFARTFIMTSGIKRSVAAAHQLKTEAHQISIKIAIKIFRFLFDLKDVLPNRNVCVKVQSILSNKLKLRLIKVLEKVLLS